MCRLWGGCSRGFSRADQTGIVVRPVLVDRSPDQLDRSYEELPNKPVSRVISDVRSLPFKNCYFDKAAIKMGLHEMPLLEQQTAVNEVYRTLKPEGVFAVWSTLALDEIEQAMFQAIVREKDRLAGFDSLARDRYLQREGQVCSLLRNAGFTNIQKVWGITYCLSTAGRLHAEFGGDTAKLQTWNDFIRSHVPEHLRGRFDYRDTETDITMKFNQGIIRCTKPLVDFNNQPNSQNERGNS